jgi:peptidoglycan L-alanyl-D-glutamate endopeptidase CwlK
MSFKLGTKSKFNLLDTHIVLVQIVEYAIEHTDVDFSVIQGLRDKVEQEINVRNGVSWTMDSYHLADEDGVARAVDIYPWQQGTSHKKEHYRRVAKAMFEGAQVIYIEPFRLEWGGFWHKPDMPHWQLIKI